MKRGNPFMLLPLFLLTFVAIFNSIDEVRPVRILALYGSGMMAGVVLANFIFFFKSRREP